MDRESFGQWKVLDTLGEGGQGRVFRVQAPTRVAEIARAQQVLGNLIAFARSPNNSGFQGHDLVGPLAEAIAILARGDEPTDLGAAKVFFIPDSGDEAERAIGRLEREVAVLREVRDPGILKLLDANVEERWMVTEYHPG